MLGHEGPLLWTAHSVINLDINSYKLLSPTKMNSIGITVILYVSKNHAAKYVHFHECLWSLLYKKHLMLSCVWTNQYSVYLPRRNICNDLKLFNLNNILQYCSMCRMRPSSCFHLDLILVSKGVFYRHVLTSITAWLSDYIYFKRGRWLNYSSIPKPQYWDR